MSLNGILDRLPAPVRHFIIVFGGAAATVVLGSIKAHSGFVGIDWVVTAADAVNAGIVSGLAGVGIVAATKLSNAYGRGSGDTSTQTDPTLAVDPPVADPAPAVDATVNPTPAPDAIPAADPATAPAGDAVA